MMNNGMNQRGVLTGQRTNQQQQAVPGQPQQSQQQINPLAMLAQAASQFAGKLNSQNNSMASLYSYGPSHTNYAELIGIGSDVSDEQIKAQALSEGGHVSYQVVQICVNRRTSNFMYQQWRNALERFKSPMRGGQHDPVMEGFVNDIDSRQPLHNFIVAQAGIQMGAVMAWRLMSGDDTVRQPGPILQDIFYKSCIDIITLQFLDHLSHHPQLFHRLSPLAKSELAKREDPTFQQVLERYVFAGLECPYSKGKLTSIIENGTLHNPLLDVTTPTDMGLGGSIFDINPIHNAGSQDVNDLSNWINQKAARTQHAQLLDGNYQPTQRNVMDVPTYDNFDRPKLNIEDINRENIHMYDLNEYIKEISDTGWYVLHRYHLDKISKALRLEDGSHFSMRDTNVLGKLAVYRFNWQQKTFAYRFINYSVLDAKEMQELLSNPSVLLPYMFEEDGVQKTTFDLKDMETSEFIRDGYVVPMEEMKTLDKKPDLLVGSRPMKANQGNENTLNRINAFTASHDPKSSLDAFVLPMVNTRQWNLDADTNMDLFYSQFKLMVHGNTEEKIDTARVIRILRGQCREFANQEFTDFLSSYLTNLVNRWLVESRGYAEDKKDKSLEYLRIGDIFEDLDDLLEYLRQKDNPALRAFMDYGSNDYLRNGIEILLGKDETRKEFEELYKNEDEATRAVMLTESKRKIIFTRQTVFINMIKENGPVQLDAVYIKESINPKLFAIVRKAIEIGSRHFKEYPQVLVKFRKDEGNKVWALTRSGLDPESVFVLRAVSSFEDYVHPVPVCE